MSTEPPPPGRPDETLHDQVPEIDRELAPEQHDSSTATRPDAPSRLPHRIGQYHIKRVIATGGMGTVYEGNQERPRRVVAVKLMKQGITSRSALRRFEYESQILARLRHPGIAQVYEAGTHTDDPGAPGAATPYFAMEYIPNALPITKYVKEKKLSTRQKLELFIQVCDAVHHGHQKGIIHRDLKPGNILVDQHGQVKIIDFGVARGTDSDMAVTTLQTDLGQLIGTLQYMSPEQCFADPHDLDTRSDVYALGVVLYELLSGKLPYTVSSARMYDGARIIREEQPTKLTTMDRTLKGDVETIVLKALEKERERRYQSTAELGQDIRRYLSNEPIVARRASVSYQFRVLVRRNKVVCGAIAATFVVLLSGVVVSTSLYVRAERAHVETIVERDRARAAEQGTAAINEFFTDMLRAVDPFEEASRLALPGASDVKVLDMLRNAVPQIDARFADRPELEAKVRLAVASAFNDLGEFQEAAEHGWRALETYRRVLGETHARTLTAMSQYAQMLQYSGEARKALPIARVSYEGLRKNCGPGDPQTVMAAYRLADIYSFLGMYTDAEQLLSEALASTGEADDPHTRARAWALWALAGAQNDLCRFQESESTAREVHALVTKAFGPDNAIASAAMMLLARSLERQGRYREAQAAFRECFSGFRERFGEDHTFTLHARSLLGDVLAEVGAFDEAETLLRTSLLGLKRRGEAFVLTTQYQLARLLNRRGAFAEAEALLREGLFRSTREWGPTHPATLRRASALAVSLHGLGRFEEAEELLHDAVVTAEDLGPEGYCEIPRLRSLFGRCLTDLNRYEEAENQLLAAYDGETAMRGEKHRYVREAVANLAHLYQVWDKLDKATEWRAKLSEEGTSEKGGESSSRSGNASDSVGLHAG